MNAHEVIANLFAMARAFGSASHDHERGSADHDVTETAAVECARLGLQLERTYRLAPPARAPLCKTCGGGRVVRVEADDTPAGLVEVRACGTCLATGVAS